jgi:hypothetical protein
VSRGVFWTSLLVYGGFGLIFAFVAIMKGLEHQQGMCAAAAAGAIYSLFRAAMVLRSGPRAPR